MYHIEIILKVIDYKNTKKISNRAIAKLFNLSRTLSFSKEKLKPHDEKLKFLTMNNCK